MEYKNIASLTEYEKQFKESQGEDAYLEGYCGNKEASMEYIESIGDEYPHYYYVTLDKVMDYDIFNEFCNKYDLSVNWCAVATDDTCIGSPIGFTRNALFMAFGEWDNEKYPNLFVWGENDDDDIDKKITDTEFMKTHFISMLKYLEDQTDFAKVVNYGINIGADSVAEYINNENLPIQGFVIEAKKDKALKLLEYPEIYGMTGR